MKVYEHGALPFTYHVVEKDHTESVEGGVIDEILVSIYVNGQELATIMCSPIEQEQLAIGFLYNERVIDSLDEIALVKLNNACTVVDVFLRRVEFDPPRRMILTSGCGGGITLQHLTETHPALESSFTTTPDVVYNRMFDLQDAARLYNLVRGVHTAVLGNTERMLVGAEDVGRHNAVDKIAGKALQGGIDTRDGIVLTSGRISSEMLGKARRMNVPIVVSRTAPTSTALRLAEAWNICIAGYARRESMRVYTHPWRLNLDEHRA